MVRIFKKSYTDASYFLRFHLIICRTDDSPKTNEYGDHIVQIKWIDTVTDIAREPTHLLF